jgi:hypothetical protein
MIGIKRGKILKLNQGICKIRSYEDSIYLSSAFKIGEYNCNVIGLSGMILSIEMNKNSKKKDCGGVLIKTSKSIKNFYENINVKSKLILGDRITGKTCIGMDIILNQKRKDVLCIYNSIGLKAGSNTIHLFFFDLILYPSLYMFFQLFYLLILILILHLYSHKNFLYFLMFLLKLLHNLFFYYSLSFLYLIPFQINLLHYNYILLF